MAEKKVTRIVAHPKLYLSVGGKLQHVKKGTEVTVTKSQAEEMGDKLIDGSRVDKLDTTTKDGMPSEGAAESEAVKQLTADLEAANAETKKAQDALVKTATDLEAAKKAVKKLEAAAKK
jgi:negative regulator of genetic competence, sporulation and motility